MHSNGIIFVLANDYLATVLSPLSEHFCQLKLCCTHHCFKQVHCVSAEHNCWSAETECKPYDFHYVV